MGTKRSQPGRQLTPDGAADLGEFLGIAKDLQRPRLTYHSIAEVAGLNQQYIHDIVAGNPRKALNVSGEAYERLAGVLRIDGVTLSSLLLRARLISALDRFRAVPLDREFVLTGTEQRLHERGYEVELDRDRLIARLIPGRDG